MTRIRIAWLSGVIAALAIGTGATAQQPNPMSPEALMGQALHEEEIDGNLESAIATFKRLIADPQVNRSLKATALLHIGRSYEKLGSVEARKAYEQLAREFADQADVASQARSRLNALGVSTETKDTRVVARQVWVGDDVNLEGRPTSDGRFLTFVDWKSSNSGNVATHDLVTGENRRLTNATAVEDGFASNPVASPDGKFVAYVWYGNGVSIRIIGMDGSRPRVLTQHKGVGIGDLYWSPDGRRLAATFNDVMGDRTERIVLVSTADGSMTTLKSTGWQSPILGGFSPDGRFLVYGIWKLSASTQSGIFAIAVDGSRETALVNGTGNDTSPMWTADGRAVLFLSDRSGQQGLWRIGVADGRPDGEPVLVRANVGDIFNLGFARDGSYFYGTTNGMRDVYVADLEPDTLHVIGQPKRLSDEFVGSNSGAAWSPDGHYVAFARGMDRTDRKIVIRSLLDGTERTLPIKLLDGFWAGGQWFPDSRSILVIDADWSKRRMMLRRVDIETGHDLTILDEDIGTVYPPFRISPDGRWLYLSRREPSSHPDGNLLRLMKRDLNSGSETELYRSESSGIGFFALAVSPTGDRLAFTFNVPGLKNTRDVIALPTSGGEPRVLYRGDFTHPAPFTSVWTRDSKYLLAVAEETRQVRRMWAFPTEGGAPVKLDIFAQGISSIDVAPNGRRIAFTKGQSKGEVWVIKNLMPKTTEAKPSSTR